MLSAMRAALWGITSNQRGLETVANNVANANTDGYRAQRYNSGTGEVRPRHDEPAPSSDQTSPPPSDVDLAEEFVDLARYELGVKANVTVVKVADRAPGTLLDIFDDRES